MKQEKIAKVPKAAVFYDGACSLCSREISNIEQRISAVQAPDASSLRFIDVHDCERLPKNKDELLKNLHLYTASGETLVGLDANIFMWRQGGLRTLPFFLRLPIVYSCAKQAYKIWAELRFKRKYKNSNR